MDAAWVWWFPICAETPQAERKLRFFFGFVRTILVSRSPMSLLVSDLQFDYPEALVATEPVSPSRVLWVESSTPQEITLQQLLQKIPAGDALVINTTRVLKRRIFTNSGYEILFLQAHSDQEWDVLFPSKGLKEGDILELPENKYLTLLKKGRPQRVRISHQLSEDYFERVAELPLPPYIQKARGVQNRKNKVEDSRWYQSAWAQHSGSLAAPTASLHFQNSDIELLRSRGVLVLEVLLHVGLGTFLPLTAENLKDHEMHEEWVEISYETWDQIQSIKQKGKKVWSLGTTVTRALESQAQGAWFQPSAEGRNYSGFTKLMIAPGYEYKVVDRLLTNFHQPGSTLLALVAAFSDLQTVKSCYRWAIDRQFRLFSYGDLSVWIK